jgi:hypothetical protein
MNLLDKANNETIKYTVDSGSQSLYSRVKFYFSTDSSVQAVNDYVDKLNSLGVDDWKLPSFSIGGNEMSSGTEYFWVKGDIYKIIIII